MKTETQIRNQILRRIQRIPGDKLKDLSEYVAKLEQNINKKEKILSYAGVWENMEDSAFEELTDKLISRRERNKRRSDE
ncbi:MAG: hypothetical protein K0B37_13960 [Bacteroidales bacterium]|jgi:hypothetical protein|nr:hypothetical protein [Bacteroidales bacterium]